MKIKTVKFDDAKMIELMNYAITDIKNKKIKVNEAINRIDHILWNYDLRLSKSQRLSLKEAFEAMTASTFTGAA